MSSKLVNFSIRKPKTLKNQAIISDFELKLPEYCCQVIKDEKHIDVIKFSICLHDGIEREPFMEFITPFTV